MLHIRKSPAVLAALSLVVLSACGAQDTQSEGEVVITVPTWAGGEANVAVARYLLEEELDYDVSVERMEESDAWEAVGSGDADAILEDWGHQDSVRKYVHKEKSVVSAGSVGINGKIGWYVPSYLAEKYPEITDWRNLNKYAHLFAPDKDGDDGNSGDDGKDGGKNGGSSGGSDDEESAPGGDTEGSDGSGGSDSDSGDSGDGGENSDTTVRSKSGAKGQILEGSKEFLTHDEKLIENLGLDLEAKYLGSESAQLKEIRERAADREPFLVYWWRPHWVEAEVELTEVQLPPHYGGCDSKPDEIECGYPKESLTKYLNADFSDNGGKAADLLRNFQWGPDDQNQVAKSIKDDGLSHRAAAEEWVKKNKGVWKVWLWGE